MSNWKLVEYEGSWDFPEPKSFIHATLLNREVCEVRVSYGISQDLGFRCTSFEIHLVSDDSNINSVFLREFNVGEINDLVLSELRKRSIHFPAYKQLKALNSELDWSKNGNSPIADINYAVVAKTYEFFSSLGSNSILQDMQKFLGDVEIEALKKRVAESRKRGFLQNRTESLGRSTQGALTDRGVQVIGSYLHNLPLKKDRRRGEKKAK